MIMAGLAIAVNVVIALFIAGNSALIRRYKKRDWKHGDKPYEFASMFRRFSANLIDSVVLVVPIVVVFKVMAIGELVAQNPFVIVLLVLASAAFYVIGGLLYHAMLEGLYGATLGKKLCGIAVLNEDFTRCSIGAAFIRNLLRIVDSFMYYLVGAVTMSGTLKWQRIGDMAAKTVVVLKEK